MGCPKCPYCTPNLQTTKTGDGKEVKEYRHDTINYPHPPYGSVYDYKTPVSKDIVKKK